MESGLRGSYCTSFLLCSSYTKLVPRPISFCQPWGRLQWRFLHRWLDTPLTLAKKFFMFIAHAVFDFIVISHTRQFWVERYFCNTTVRLIFCLLDLTSNVILRTFSSTDVWLAVIGNIPCAPRISKKLSSIMVFCSLFLTCRYHLFEF